MAFSALVREPLPVLLACRLDKVGHRPRKSIRLVQIHERRAGQRYAAPARERGEQYWGRRTQRGHQRLEVEGAWTLVLRLQCGAISFLGQQPLGKVDPLVKLHQLG